MTSSFIRRTFLLCPTQWMHRLGKGRHRFAACLFSQAWLLSASASALPAAAMLPFSCFSGFRLQSDFKAAGRLQLFGNGFFHVAILIAVTQPPEPGTAAFEHESETTTLQFDTSRF